MKIRVVCGAGASSTFVAQRLRTAAASAGVIVDVEAHSDTTVLDGLAAGDLVLAGPHLAARLPQLQADTETIGARTILLPDDIFGDLDGHQTLALVQSALDDGRSERASNRKETE